MAEAQPTFRVVVYIVVGVGMIGAGLSLSQTRRNVQRHMEHDICQLTFCCRPRRRGDDRGAAGDPPVTRPMADLDDRGPHCQPAGVFSALRLRRYSRRGDHTIPGRRAQPWDEYLDHPLNAESLDSSFRIVENSTDGPSP
jgi:hypothetical protein